MVISLWFFLAIVNKMRLHGDKSEDVVVAEKILRSLTPKCNFVVCSIEESHDIDELPLDVKFDFLQTLHIKGLLIAEVKIKLQISPAKL